MSVRLNLANDFLIIAKRPLFNSSPILQVTMAISTMRTHNRLTVRAVLCFAHVNVMETLRAAH
jgi:hypothetical protein